MLIKNLASFIKSIGVQTISALTENNDDEPHELMGDIIEPIDPDIDIGIEGKDIDEKNRVIVKTTED